jgi:hypothetical protein
MRYTKRNLLFSVLLFFFAGLGMQTNAQVSKSKLKVLYVGGKPDAYEIVKQLSKKGWHHLKPCSKAILTR